MININNTTEDLYNKIITDPILNGNIIFQEGNTNVELGFKSGGYMKNINYKKVSGKFRSSKNLDIYANSEDGYYNGWMVRTTTNNITSSHFIEDYIIGYPYIEGIYKSPSNLKPVVQNTNEYTFNLSVDGYYKGWTLTNWSSSNIKTQYTITSLNQNYEILILTSP